MQSVVRGKVQGGLPGEEICVLSLNVSSVLLMAREIRHEPQKTKAEISNAISIRLVDK